MSESHSMSPYDRAREEELEKGLNKMTAEMKESGDAKLNTTLAEMHAAEMKKKEWDAHMAFLDKELALERAKLAELNAIAQTKETIEQVSTEDIPAVTPELIAEKAHHELPERNTPETQAVLPRFSDEAIRKRYGTFRNSLATGLAVIFGFGAVAPDSIDASARSPHADTKPADEDETPGFSASDATPEDIGPTLEMSPNPEPITPPSEEILEELVEEETEQIGEYVVKKGEGFYASARKALEDALAKPGVDKDAVLGQILIELGMELDDIKDEEKIITKWVLDQGQKNGITMLKQGGYKYTKVLHEGNTINVIIQPEDSNFGPTVNVIGATELKKAKIHNPRISYTTTKGKTSNYEILGPSQDGGLIIKDEKTNRSFAISQKAVQERTRLIKGDVAPPPIQYVKQEKRVRMNKDEVEDTLLEKEHLPTDTIRLKAIPAWNTLEKTLRRNMLGQDEEFNKTIHTIKHITSQLAKQGKPGIATATDMFQRLNRKIEAVQIAKEASDDMTKLFVKYGYEKRTETAMGAESIAKFVRDQLSKEENKIALTTTKGINVTEGSVEP